MPNLRNYFCNKIAEIKDLEIYTAYTNELLRLKSDQEYQSLLQKLSTLSGDEYRELKLVIKQHEQELLMNEKLINEYIEHITKQYNNLLEIPQSGSSCQRR